MSLDPYVYPETDILINKLSIRDDKVLQEMEIKLVNLRLVEGLPVGNFDYEHLKAIHHHLFQDLYDWAGQERTVKISKGTSQFAFPGYIKSELDKLFKQLKTERFLQELTPEKFAERAAFYFNEVNAAHPFREGNGRTNRIFFSKLSHQAGYSLAWHKTSHKEFIQASIDGFNGDYSTVARIFERVASPLAKTISVEKNHQIDIDYERNL